jgi:hypothetical protein
MHAEPARLVAGGRHHPALPAAADGHRPATQLGIVPLFDRRVEGVHVDVDNTPRSRWLTGRRHDRSAVEERRLVRVGVGNRACRGRTANNSLVFLPASGDDDERIVR